MGWSLVFRPEGQPLLQFFADLFRIDTPTQASELVDLAVVHRRVGYGAWRTTCKSTNETYTHALVMLLSFPNGHQYENLGYKDMSESDEPRECACPLRIYRQLTPLPNPPGALHDPWAGARRWRQRVEAYHAARTKLVDGALVFFDEPLRLKSGEVLQELTVWRTPTGALRLRDPARPDVLYRHASLEQLIAEGKAQVVQ